MTKIGPEKIAGKSVLEIGASHYSSLAPVFSYLRANAKATYFGTSPEPFIRNIEAQYKLPGVIPVSVLDIRQPPNGEKYDIVVAKSVLGTPAFNHDDHELERAIQHMKQMLAPGGLLITLDNARGIWPQLWLRNKIGSGRDGWRYFSRREYKKFVLNPHSDFMSFGFTSFVDYRRPKLQSALANFDRKFDWLIPTANRCVFVGVTPEGGRAATSATK